MAKRNYEMLCNHQSLWKPISKKKKNINELSLTFGIRFAWYAETHHTFVIHLMNTITSNVELVHWLICL